MNHRLYHTSNLILTGCINILGKSKKLNILLVHYPNLVITEELVYQKISKVNATKAIGPDQIHPYILATLCEHLCKPLCLIYNQSLQLGQLPEDWKLANVTPEMVKEIYLTTIALSVWLLRLVRYWNQLFVTILLHFYLIKTFSVLQHGFTYHKSCFTN